MEEKQIIWIDTNEALEIMQKSTIIKLRYKPNRPTLISWAIRYNLGYKFAGKWQINKQKLIDFLDAGAK